MAENNDYTKLIFKTAWQDTCAFFGWNIRTFIIPTFTAIGFGVYWYFMGWDAVKEELIITALIILGPMGAFAFLLIIWNLFVVPFKLVWQEVRNLKQAPLKLSPVKLTQRERFIKAASRVVNVKIDLTDLNRYVSPKFDDSIPPKVNSLYVDLRKLGLQTPDILVSDWGRYLHFHLYYLNNIYPYMRAGQTKEAKESAKQITASIQKEIKDDSDT